MEHTTTPAVLEASDRTKRSTPWGLFIGLLLILGIIVSGAYYALTERLTPVAPTSVTK